VVFAVANEAGVRRLVHISSVSVYGVSPHHLLDGEVTEATPFPPEIDRWAYYLRSKVAAERAFHRDSEGGRPDVVILRPGIIYGRGATEPLTKSLVHVGPLRVIVGDGRNTLPLSFVDNVVDGVLLALTHPRGDGQAYNLVDDPQLTVREIAQHVGAVAGERVRLVGIPSWVLMPVARWLEDRAVSKGAEEPPRLSRFQIAQATRDFRYSSRRAREELGWTPEVGLAEGLRRTFPPDRSTHGRAAPKLPHRGQTRQRTQLARRKTVRG
jgi:nucleoside-diphosphate-sugar epimerase